MASNKDSKTSKTAHVMNLLSRNRNADPVPEAPAPEAPASPAAQTPPPAQAPAPAPAPSAPVPPIISSLNADAAVSSQIKDALEAALEPAAPARPAPQTAAPAAPPAQPSAPAHAPDAPVQPSAPAPEAPPVQYSAPAPAPEAPPVRPGTPTPQPVPAEEDLQGTYEAPVYVNVMEVLVREKTERYMRASGMCCCDQCIVDVQAYTLNHLPPKYVVMSKGEMIPKLTFYEVQSSSDITTQLMRACDIVSKSPHHSRG